MQNDVAQIQSFPFFRESNTQLTQAIIKLFNDSTFSILFFFSLTDKDQLFLQAYLW